MVSVRDERSRSVIGGNRPSGHPQSRSEPLQTSTGHPGTQAPSSSHAPSPALNHATALLPVGLSTYWPITLHLCPTGTGWPQTPIYGGWLTISPSPPSSLWSHGQVLPGCLSRGRQPRWIQQRCRSETAPEEKGACACRELSWQVPHAQWGPTGSATETDSDSSKLQLPGTAPRTGNRQHSPRHRNTIVPHVGTAPVNGLQPGESSASSTRLCHPPGPGNLLRPLFLCPQRSLQVPATQLNACVNGAPGWVSRWRV